MRSSQDNTARSHFTVYEGGLSNATINIQIVFVSRQDLDAALLHLVRINKHPAPIVIRPEALGQYPSRPERLLPHFQPHGPGAALARIPKPGEGGTAAGAGEEGQLTWADDLHSPVGAADLELAAGGAVVAAGAEAEVGAAAAHEGVDDAVPGAVENAAVVEVGAAGYDEESGGGGPGLAQKGGLGERDDGVIRREQAAEGVDALPDGGDGCASAWGECQSRGQCCR